MSESTLVKMPHCWKSHVAAHIHLYNSSGLLLPYILPYIYLTFTFTITLQANEMIGNIRNAFNELINDLDWMDEETKNLAREKVGYSIRIGYRSYITSIKELSGNQRCFNGLT